MLIVQTQNFVSQSACLPACQHASLTHSQGWRPNKAAYSHQCLVYTQLNWLLSSSCNKTKAKQLFPFLCLDNAAK